MKTILTRQHSIPTFLLFLIFFVLSVQPVANIYASPSSESEVDDEVFREFPNDPFHDPSSTGSYSDYITLIGIGNIEMPQDNCPSFPRPRSISTDERLTIQTEHGWMPNLAKDVRPTDSSALVVELRKTKWSDGTPFLADDVVFSANLVRQYPEFFGFPVANFDVDKVDDYHVKFIFLSSIHEPLALLHYIKLFPKNRFPDASTLDKSILSCLTRGSIGYLGWPTVGAYVLTHIDSTNRTIRFQPNSYYFKIDANRKQQPYYNEVIYTLSSSLSDLAKAVAIVQERTRRPVDVVELPGNFMSMLLANPEEFYALSLDREIDVQRSDARGSAVAYFFNYRHIELGALFRERAFREATSLAIDRTHILDDVFYRRHTLMEPTAVVVGSQWTEYKSVGPPIHDPGLAGSRLGDAKQTAGFDGQTVSFRILVSYNDALLQQAIERIIQDWKAIGIAVESVPVSEATRQNREAKGQFEAIARSFWLPERWVRRGRSGLLIPPFLEEDLDSTGDLQEGDSACDQFCQDLIDFRKTLIDWQDSDDTNVYRANTKRILEKQARYLFAVGVVSEFPRLVFFLKNMVRCDSDRSRGDYVIGGDRYCRE